MLKPCGARSRICCLSYRVTRNVHRCSIGLQVTSASVSAYSICAGADIDSDFWGRPGLPLVLNGGGAPQLSLIIMRLTATAKWLDATHCKSAQSRPGIRRPRDGRWLPAVGEVSTPAAGRGAPPGL